MRLKFILISILSSLVSVIASQNLIPDGGFENAPGCANPEMNFSNSLTWYPLEATPDLFIGGCNYELSGNYFWDSSIEPVEGRNFAGLAARWNSNETYVSEGIATRLIAPLEPEQTYYLTLYIKNQGGYQGLADLTTCVLRPEKHLDIYLSRDSIYLDNNFSNGTASSSGSLAGTIASEAVKSTIIGDWTRVTMCFVAAGGEQYLAIQMPLGTFGDLPPCASQASSGVFRSFYYFLDDIQLSNLAIESQNEATICKGEGTTIDLRVLFENTISIESMFTWQDGFVGSVRKLNKPGQYMISASTECGTIPLMIEAKEINCKVQYYAPTAFSPNNDGINDYFQLFFNADTKPQTFDLIIYDHWGNLVFRSSDLADPWDGSINGNKAASGTYLWVVTLGIQTATGQENISEGGSLTLFK